MDRGPRALDFTPAGLPGSLTGVCLDVTEQRVSEGLHRSEALLKMGAELAGLACYQVDFISGVVFTDDRFFEMCGTPAAQRGSLQAVAHWMAHLHPDDRARVMDLREQLYGGTLERTSVEYRYLHPVRGQRWLLQLAGVARRDAAGRATVSYGVLQDVTERMRAADELSNLSRRLIRAQEEERAMIARELHDDITQRLAVLAIDAGRAELVAESEAQAGAMRALREELTRVSEDVHSLAYQLHSAVLEELGLDEALCLFRVAQEALSNVARHSRARRARVTLRRMEGGFHLAVKDDGIGFDPACSDASRSLGLVSMRERVRIANGTLEIEAAPGQGAAIMAWVPAGVGPR